ncbi:adenylate/guanylate cyclase domain-containing protein [Ruegeria sp. PrR005]|uniref:Adenylate/guanylate cyclase domain-containing protein n=1 Tax=Ruegeria sp. PrR005 TaxID=2706882 RepID=A0A6B2NUC7_9RHOB|nr:adenylate/guanylate cyclase domain-containing protein [Ruegeria sp. PrR005]NDW47756.1 adenylate/guanylate cyclase domain-containing protein [Ruegeria sp. PrR005]
MQRPKTRFTKAGDVWLAYQVVGEGPVDLVYASGWLHNIDIIWEHSAYRRLLETLASFSRLILFDKRGTGLSDRETGAPTLEERAEDIRAVMDAAGSQRATILGHSEGGHVTAMFAACYPERVRSIILLDCRPCNAWKPDWPTGMRRAEFEAFATHLVENWGKPDHLGEQAPSLAGIPEEEEWYARMLIHAASPSSAAAYAKIWYELDVRAVLPSIACPALIFRRPGDRTTPAEQTRYLAEHIPDSRLIEIGGADHAIWAGDQDECLGWIRDFIDDERTGGEDRVLLSVLMSDIVGSTEIAARLGDAAWRDKLAAHDAAAALAVRHHAGHLVKSTGDGFMATFAGPSRAIACARDMHAEAARLGLTLRAGAHTGECLRHGQADVTGLGVVIAARIMEAAGAGETLISSTMCDLMAGSRLAFDDIGIRDLKGVPGQWRLARLGDPDRAATDPE